MCCFKCSISDSLSRWILHISFVLNRYKHIGSEKEHFLFIFWHHFRLLHLVQVWGFLLIESHYKWSHCFHKIVPTPWWRLICQNVSVLFFFKKQKETSCYLKDRCKLNQIIFIWSFQAQNSCYKERSPTHMLFKSSFCWEGQPIIKKTSLEKACCC